MNVIVSEIQAKRQTGIGSDGAFPLMPLYNNLISVNPETYKFANEGYGRNSIVFNVITRRAEAIHQVPLIITKKKKGEVAKKKKLQPEDNDLSRLFDQPNVYQDLSDFLQYCSIYTDVGGRTFIHKVRDGYGVVTELYPYHASQITIEQGTDRMIEGYWYDNGAGYRKFIPPEDMFQIRFPSVNFWKPYTSWSPLLALAKEVDIDNQRGELQVALMLNGGVPPFAIYPGDTQPEFSQDSLDGAVEKVVAKINGRNRGKPLLMNKDFKIEKIGYNPKDLDLTTFSAIPETRICAIYRVPVGYAQMLTGLENAGTYANREADKTAFYEDAMIPLWTSYARAFYRGLKDETFYDGKGSDFDFAFDYSDLPALMESDSNLQGKVIDQWRFNLIPRDKALELIGEEEIGGEEGQQYYSETTGTAWGTVDPKDQPAKQSFSLNGHAKVNA